MKTSVVIPAYRRPIDLRRCLNALRNQTVVPAEIIVTVREFDVECKKAVSEMILEMNNLKLLIVQGVGQIHAWKKGYENTTGDIVSFLDDDSEPAPDWVEQIINHFSKSKCAGVGGYTPNVDSYGKEIYIKGKKDEIGKLFWFGRFLGNFHHYYRRIIKVDSLRGANMSFRREYIENNFRFKLKGREYKNDTALSWEVINRGGYLEYNPKIKVRHHAGKQFINKGRTASKEEQYANSYNTTFLFLKYKNLHQILLYLFFSITIGQDDAP
ncbi:MAG: glycosyltransferase family 2 protein, partial [bacterium]|nr:glycosyltransferase family 2 protein [bacterium]